MKRFKQIVVGSPYEMFYHHKETCPLCQEAVRSGERGCAAGLDLWRAALSDEWRKLDIRVEVTQ
jgi:hypothetical protein